MGKFGKSTLVVESVEKRQANQMANVPMPNNVVINVITFRHHTVQIAPTWEEVYYRYTDKKMRKCGKRDSLLAAAKAELMRKN